MAKKTLGYTRLEWTCPNCSTKNPGPQQTCVNCGGPQPEDVAFEQAAQETLIADETDIAQAQTGPDIHCYYCGTRNPAGAETCSQCGGDLTQGTARRHGQVLGAHRAEAAAPITCPSCGTSNPADAPTCQHCGASLAEGETPKPKPSSAPTIQRRASPISRLVVIAVVLLVCAGAATFGVMVGRTADITGTVNGVSWSRSIALEELRPVTHEAWLDEIPGDSVIGVCTQKVHHTQDDPAPNSEEVCGTPFTVDTGSGFGEVVQDCEYRVFEDWCEYTLDEWQRVDAITLAGNDFNPQWPVMRLGVGQREGVRAEEYEITFATETGTYTYRPRNAEDYDRYVLGSRWILRVNSFNQVLSTEAVR